MVVLSAALSSSVVAGNDCSVIVGGTYTGAAYDMEPDDGCLSFISMTTWVLPPLPDAGIPELWGKTLVKVRAMACKKSR